MCWFLASLPRTNFEIKTSKDVTHHQAKYAAKFIVCGWHFWNIGIRLEAEFPKMMFVTTIVINITIYLCVPSLSNTPMYYINLVVYKPWSPIPMIIPMMIISIEFWLFIYIYMCVCVISIFYIYVYIPYVCVCPHILLISEWH